MAIPFGKAPSWRKVFLVLIEFGGKYESASFECKDAPPIYRLTLNGKELLFPISNQDECLAPSLAKYVTRQLGLPKDAFGEQFDD